DKLLENLRSARGFQIESDAALVAVGQMPGIGIFRLRLRRGLVANPPEVAARRLPLYDVGAEVGQDHRGAGTRDETCEVHHLQSGENVVACHVASPVSRVRLCLHRPWNWGVRFSRKAVVPSFLSSVAAQRPK